MNQETVENLIKPLNKTDFDLVCHIILERVFKIKFVDIDGKGDGGADYRIFSDEATTPTAIQKTTQNSNWEDKAFSDAKNAVEKLKAKRFFFLTSRSHSNTAFRNLENKITTTLSIPATCLGAAELAGLIVENNLIGELLDNLHIRTDLQFINRDDKNEVLLHSYIAIGSDKTNFNEEIYDDTIFAFLYSQPDSVSREILVTGCINFLGCSDHKKNSITGRIDSLLTRGKISLTSDKKITLARLTFEEMKAAEDIYTKEISDLAKLQADFLKENFEIVWNEVHSKEAAVLLARLFMFKQLKNAEQAYLKLNTTGILKAIGDPEKSLIDMFIQSGIPANKAKTVLADFVDLAADKPIIIKLTRAAICAALEGESVVKKSKALGANSWSEVDVILDTPVAIPYLCSKLFEPSFGRFSKSAVECVDLLKECGAKICIPTQYLNESSAHLLSAMDYIALSEFDDDLAYSDNGYVSHYFQLKKMKASCPSSLTEYLSIFSNELLRSEQDKEKTIFKIANDLQSLLKRYGIDIQNTSNVANHFVKQIETEYTYQQQFLKRKKPLLLMNHDVTVLANMLRRISQDSKTQMCLTWDTVLIAINKRIEKCGWVVTPHEANDLIQQGAKISSVKLRDLAHSLAMVREKPSIVAGKLMDRVVHYAKVQLQDWQFIQEIKKFKAELLATIDTTTNLSDDNYFETEINNFLKSKGVTILTEDDKRS